MPHGGVMYILQCFDCFSVWLQDVAMPAVFKMVNTEQALNSHECEIALCIL